MYRNEPGFRSLRLGDGLAPSFLTGETHNMTVLAKALAAMFAETHSLEMTPEMLHHVEVATTAHIALVDLAFEKDPQGDEQLIIRAKELASNYILSSIPISLVTESLGT